MNATVKTTDKPAHLRHSLKRGHGIYHLAQGGRTLCGAEGYSNLPLTVITRSAEDLHNIEDRHLICRTCTRNRYYYGHMWEFAQELNEAEAAPKHVDLEFLARSREPTREEELEYPNLEVVWDAPDGRQRRAGITLLEAWSYDGDPYTVAGAEFSDWNDFPEPALGWCRFEVSR